jgi:hypothetical protein
MDLNSVLFGTRCWPSTISQLITVTVDSQLTCSVRALLYNLSTGFTLLAALLSQCLQWIYSLLLMGCNNTISVFVKMASVKLVKLLNCKNVLNSVVIFNI